ncbi:FG-GAP-like repeat-containing protein [Lentzea sp. NBC_00516]|uniref:C40 family peptidase n=1 Tax=Lentzea sp. NBC_00516 TaxID=2903582 RepID=UPI002E809360|nr:FG-GAP-like repeat-containing protein [Lentzea sp. NBC_00516]WUD22667.1 FG-GAP-like repeat-containing protein [Lentzea sp. NBC_00516]
MRLRRMATLLALVATAVTFLGPITGQAAPEPGTLVTDGGYAKQGEEPEPGLKMAANNPIARSEVMKRAETWLKARVPYSQTSWYANEYGSYRADCSGFTSMAWGMDNSYTTYSLQPFMHSIAKSELKPGDVLWKHNSDQQHIAIFVRWDDGAQTKAVVWEEWDFGQVAEQRTWSAAYTASYAAKRYNNIVEDSVGQTGSSFSGDAKTDVGFISADGNVKVWRNGRGFAQNPWNADAVVANGFTDENAHFADLDGDGDKEIITVLPDGQVKAWRNNGTFGPSPWDADAVIASGFTNQSLHFADLDGDRKAEIITVLPDGQVKAWHNYHGFTNSPWDNEAIIASGFTNDSLHFADLNADGKAEIITVLGDGQVKAWRNYWGFKANPWDNDAIIATGFTNQSLHFADLDGDGKAEIVTVLPDGQVKAWHNYHGFANNPWDNEVIFATGFTNTNLHLI